MQARSLFDVSLLQASPGAERRVLALVFPQLMCELIELHLVCPEPVGPSETPRVLSQVSGVCPASELKGRPRERERPQRDPAFGVVLVEAVAGPNIQPIYDTSVRASARLQAVNSEARRLGVRAGQTIAEAHAVLASLQVFQVTTEQLQQALGRLAEMAMDLGPLVSVGAPDTVWVDVTGASHLQGGEAALLSEVLGRVRALGHRVRAALAPGPLLARAFALWGSPGATPRSEPTPNIVFARDAAAKIALLPLVALPLNADQLRFFARVGVLNVGELQALPKAAVSSRLGESSARVLALVAGLDNTPLVAYQPPRVLAEQASFAEGILGIQPLLFVLRGLLARVSVRLLGRGEAAQELQLSLQHDRKIAEFHGRPLETKLSFALASPLWKEEELLRVLRSKVERLQVNSPTISVCVEVMVIVPAQSLQLTLASVVGGLTERAFDEGELAVLLAELNADIGKENVGVLKLLDSHRPEARSTLFSAVVATSASRGKARKHRKPPTQAVLARTQTKAEACEIQPNAEGARLSPVRVPTRLLPKPLLIEGSFRIGEIIGIGANLYTLERAIFDHRLEAVQWWSKQAVSRDYLRLWLKGPEGGVAALGYVNRDSGSRYIQAIYD